MLEVILRRVASVAPTPAATVSLGSTNPRTHPTANTRHLQNIAFDACVHAHTVGDTSAKERAKGLQLPPSILWADKTLITVGVVVVWIGGESGKSNLVEGTHCEQKIN